MAYTPTNWLARVGTALNRFLFTDNGDGSMNLTADPTGITTNGTPISTANLNKIEQGIKDVHNPAFTEADTLANIATGEVVETLWGKVKKAIATVITHAGWLSTLNSRVNQGVKTTDSPTFASVDDASLVGTIIHTARSTPPTGYLKANGVAISRTTYSALFSAIGTVFGAGNGSTTFNLPELRGEFVRGLDDGRGVDSGRVLGTAQADELKAHTHLQRGTSANNLDAGAYEIQTQSTTDNINTGSTGGTETRPRNVSLLYCIKY